MGLLFVTIISGALLLLDIISVKLFLIVTISSLVWMYIAPILYFKLGWLRFFYHDFLHWHTPDGSPHSFDGLSEHAICKHCGKDIMQDSQGNWF